MTEMYVLSDHFNSNFINHKYKYKYAKHAKLVGVRKQRKGSPDCRNRVFCEATQSTAADHGLDTTALYQRVYM
jgi:hypothetical protein